MGIRRLKYRAMHPGLVPLEAEEAGTISFPTR